METNTCKRCGKTLQNGEGVNGLCDECLTSSKYKNTDNNMTNAERTLQVIAVTTLVVGIICSIYFAFNLTMKEVSYGYLSYKKFSIEGLAITIATLFSSICTWALLFCFAEISSNIRKIANKNK